MNSPNVQQSQFGSLNKKSPTFRPNSQVRRTQQDEQRARELMNAQSHSNSDFTYKEATAVLTLIAEANIDNVTPGLVQVLLDDFDADVNLKRRRSNSLWKRMSDKDQEDVRGNLLERATINCSSEILLLLVPHADEVAVNQALPHAMMQNDMDKISILLARGGDAISLCSQFAHVLESPGSDEIIAKLMMNRTKGACQACRDKGLIRMAELGFANKARTLLDNGANVMFDGASALMAAVRHQRDDIASPIALRGTSVIPENVLDEALGDAYGKGMLQTVNSCLFAGSKGPKTDAVLTEAVRNGQLELVSNLVQHGAAVNHASGSAVVCAVESGRPEMLRAVLAGKPSLESMAAAMMQTPRLGNIQSAHQMIGLLLAAGLRGEAISHVLAQVMDKQQMKGEERVRLGLVRLLLTKGNADVNLRAGRSLAIAADEGWVDILKELLQSRPSLESRVSVLRSAMKMQPVSRKRVIDLVFEGVQRDPKLMNQLKDVAVTLAAKSLHLDVLKDLTPCGLDEVTVQAGFDAVVSIGTAWMSAAGLQVVQFFLNKGASGQSVEYAFYEAATVANVDAFDLLSTSITSISVLNTALTGVARRANKWLSADDRNIWLIDSLLAWGARGDCVNLAFLAALSSHITGGASKTVLDLLLKVGRADVNFQHGEALKIAVRGGNVPLVTHLASNGASQETMTYAFWETISSPLEEGVALELIDALVSSKDRVSKPTLSVVLPDRLPHIYECLKAHPNSAKLVRRLAELGCDVDAEIVTELYDVTERANALSWALRPCRGVPIISTEAIGALIDLKANVCFTAPFSKTTPLILAAKHGRGDVVKNLIKAGADPSSRDRDERAAIFHASTIGDLESVKTLLKSKYRPNDGSLHEAARNLHSEVVMALIKGEYDVNFPSSRLEHEGRTPLQELAYRCRAVNRIQDTEDTMLALKKGKVDALKKWHGKTPLFLALDNECSLEVTRALLDILMWQYMESFENVYAEPDMYTGVTIFRSATVYLTHFQESSKQYFQLLQLLQSKGCIDRYYAQFGAMQPPNAVGLPEDIAREEKRRYAEGEKIRKTEEEHQEKLRRMQEESHLKATIDESKHEIWARHEYQKAIHKVGSSAIVHDNELHQKAQLTEQQRFALAQKNALVEQDRQNLEHHKQRTAVIGQMKIAGEQQIKLDYAQRTANQKMEAQKHQLYYAQKADTQKLATQHAQNNLKKQAAQIQIASQYAQNNLKTQANQNQIVTTRKLQAIKHS
ncbi:hypothetical protein G7054_g9424 [Neopestalotiopsis clavispora]|nr:hypothetical protein G7054_g9424 [Neopestalotiopsis clavispora]